MKQILILLSFLLAWNAQGQELIKTYNSTVTLDDAVTADTFYVLFGQPSVVPGRVSDGGVKSDTTAYIENPAMFNGFLGVTIKIDSLKADTVIDSVWQYYQAVDLDKYAFGTKFYLDFTNNDSTGSVDYIENAVPDNRTAGTTPTTVAGWADLDNILSSAAHGFMVVTGMTNVAVADSILVDSNISIGIPK